jgi:hypothetical protein
MRRSNSAGRRRPVEPLSDIKPRFPRTQRSHRARPVGAVAVRIEKRQADQDPVPGERETCRQHRPWTWATFEDALGAWSRNRQRYVGLGFVFSREDPFAGIDLDDSLDEQGDVKAWARGTIERFSDTYVEISPSCQGLKIWLRGSLPANVPGVQVGDGSIELYDHSRYFAVTDCGFRGAPLEIEDRAGDLLMLYDRLTAGRKGWAFQPVSGGGQISHGRQHNTLVSLCGTLRASRRVRGGNRGVSSDRQ